MHVSQCPDSASRVFRTDPASLAIYPAAQCRSVYFHQRFDQTLRDEQVGGQDRRQHRIRWDVSGYYHFDDFNVVNPYGGASLPGFQSQNVGRAQLFVLTFTKTFGGNAVNEFHLSFTRDGVLPGKPVGGVGPKLSSLGFVEGSGTLGIIPNAPEYEGVPNIGFNAYSIGTAAYVTGHWENIYQGIDNFAKVSGHHSFKLGAASTGTRTTCALSPPRMTAPLTLMEAKRALTLRTF